MPVKGVIPAARGLVEGLLCCTLQIHITTDNPVWENYIKSLRMNRKLRSIDCCTVSVPAPDLLMDNPEVSPGEMRDAHACLPLTFRSD